MNPNKKYKDSVFTTVFSDEVKLLELYSAISDKNYPSDTKIEINTLADALYLDRNNDISFLVDNKLIVLIEAQTTINENMPLRCLIYLSRIYEKIIDNKTIYRRTLVYCPFDNKNN